MVILLWIVNRSSLKSTICLVKSSKVRIIWAAINDNQNVAQRQIFLLLLILTLRRLLGNGFWRVLLSSNVTCSAYYHHQACCFYAKCTHIGSLLLSKSKVHCLCVTFQINMMTNLFPEATKQLPTQVNVTAINTNHHKKKKLRPTIWKAQHPLSHRRLTFHGCNNTCSFRECTVFFRSPTVSDFNLEGYLPSVFVDGSTMGRVDAIAIPVHPLNQSVVTGASDWVQPWRKATLRKRARGFSQLINTSVS